MIRPRLLPLLLAAALSACSPSYAVKSASGHLGLLARSRPIEKALQDPRVPEGDKERLRLVLELRAFGFERMGLRRSRDYGSYTPVDGRAVTYLVTAARRTRLELYRWRFPLIGSFPYKGFFKREDAQAEAARMERRGFDAHVSGAAAYNTPLWIADPLPSSALRLSTGALSALILHELAHGTVFIKGQVPFNEALATFVGEKGAELFLAERFGPESAELKAFLRERESDRAFEAAVEELHAALDELYRGPGGDEEKLAGRGPIFERGRERLRAAGWEYESLNNATVLAIRVYRSDQESFRRAFGSVGGDWTRFFALVRSLDRAAPAADLSRRFPG